MKICNFLVPVDFVVQDMEMDMKTPLIIERLFLSIAKANIDAGARVIHLNINGKKKFAFKPKEEQFNQVKTFRCQAPKKAPKPNVDLSNKGPQVNSLVATMKKSTSERLPLSNKKWWSIEGRKVHKSMLEGRVRRQRKWEAKIPFRRSL